VKGLREENVAKISYEGTMWEFLFNIKIKTQEEFIYMMVCANFEENPS